MYAIFVTVKVKPDKRQQFLEVIEHDTIASERDEPGCMRFNVLQDADDENTYYFYEVYKDETAFQAHTQTPHLQAWRAAAAEVLVAPSTRITTRSVFPRDAAYWERGKK